MARYCMRPVPLLFTPAHPGRRVSQKSHPVAKNATRVGQPRSARNTGGKLHTIRRIANYLRNLPELTRVPRITLVWVTKLFSSVPMKRRLAP